MMMVFVTIVIVSRNYQHFADGNKNENETIPCIDEETNTDPSLFAIDSEEKTNNNNSIEMDADQTESLAQDEEVCCFVVFGWKLIWNRRKKNHQSYN